MITRLPQPRHLFTRDGWRVSGCDLPDPDQGGDERVATIKDQRAGWVRVEIRERRRSTRIEVRCLKYDPDRKGFLGKRGVIVETCGIRHQAADTFEQVIDIYLDALIEERKAGAS